LKKADREADFFFMNGYDVDGISVWSVVVAELPLPRQHFFQFFNVIALGFYWMNQNVASFFYPFADLRRGTRNFPTGRWPFARTNWRMPRAWELRLIVGNKLCYFLRGFPSACIAPCDAGSRTDVVGADIAGHWSLLRNTIMYPAIAAERIEMMMPALRWGKPR